MISDVTGQQGTVGVLPGWYYVALRQMCYQERVWYYVALSQPKVSNPHSHDQFDVAVSTVTLNAKHGQQISYMAFRFYMIRLVDREAMITFREDKQKQGIMQSGIYKITFFFTHVDIVTMKRTRGQKNSAKSRKMEIKNKNIRKPDMLSIQCHKINI